jgi:UDP-3-O-[3-hydroxymyristoyl] glucosamine N-acyltransferase
MITYTISDLFPYLGENYEIVGKPDGCYFNNVKPINEADIATLVWVNPLHNDKHQLLSATKAMIIISGHEMEISTYDKVLIKVDQPKLVFLRVVGALFSKKIEYGVHPTAFIHPEAELHAETYIGPFCYVGVARIGRGTIIKGHCHISDNTIIENNVIIHPGTVIGADGYGYARNEKGELEKFPHIGGVHIESNVEIGSSTCIDRGTLGNTHIQEGAKIDNLVHIAHNVSVGKNAAVIANAMVGGSTSIGKNSWIAPSACLRDGISIGADVTVGLGALVTKSIPDGEVWTGFPAKKMK